MKKLIVFLMAALIGSSFSIEPREIEPRENEPREIASGEFDNISFSKFTMYTTFKHFRGDGSETCGIRFTLKNYFRKITRNGKPVACKSVSLSSLAAYLKEKRAPRHAQLVEALNWRGETFTTVVNSTKRELTCNVFFTSEILAKDNELAQSCSSASWEGVLDF